jgi:hypothetical protein
VNVYITARGQYAVEKDRYILEVFPSLRQAVAFIRQAGEAPVFTWFN